MPGQVIRQTERTAARKADGERREQIAGVQQSSCQSCPVSADGWRRSYLQAADARSATPGKHGLFRLHDVRPGCPRTPTNGAQQAAASMPPTRPGLAGGKSSR